jgi:hypothetical protein
LSHGEQGPDGNIPLEQKGAKLVQGKGFFGTLFDLSFSEFITTKLIKVLYILLLILVAIGFVIAFFSSLVTMFSRGGFLQGLVGIVLTPIGALIYVILARMWMELIIVIFRIAENTTELVRLKRGE